LIDPNDVLEGTVVRVPKAYPAYFGAYAGIGRVRDYLNQFTNLFRGAQMACIATITGSLDARREGSGRWASCKAAPTRASLSITFEDDYHEECAGRQPIAAA